MPQHYTAVVAESRPEFRAAILQMLSTDPAAQATLLADDLEEVLNRITTTHPDLAIVDRDWPNRDPFDLLRRVQQLSPGTSTVLAAAHFTRSDVARARDMGARGCILKSARLEDLRAVIKGILAEKSAFTRVQRGPEAARHATPQRRSGPDSPIRALTRRELQVLTHVGRGLSSKEIALALNVSVKTVDRHRTNLMTKLDIHDRVQLALCAIREGLVTP